MDAPLSCIILHDTKHQKFKLNSCWNFKFKTYQIILKVCHKKKYFINNIVSFIRLIYLLGFGAWSSRNIFVICNVFFVMKINYLYPTAFHAHDVVIVLRLNFNTTLSGVDVNDGNIFFLLCHNAANFFFSPAYYSNDWAVWKLEFWILAAKCHYPFFIFIEVESVMTSFHFISLCSAFLVITFYGSADLEMSLSYTFEAVFTQFPARFRRCRLFTPVNNWIFISILIYQQINFNGGILRAWTWFLLSGYSR